MISPIRFLSTRLGGLLIAIVVVSALFIPHSASAQNLLMARTASGFDVTMLSVERALNEHGYTVSHIQECDGGLHGMGYETDKYRVIFFGKPEEVRSMVQRYPDMVPYFPQKVVVYAEGDHTVISLFNPEEFMGLFPQRELRIQFQRWKNDYESILDDVRREHSQLERKG